MYLQYETPPTMINQTSTSVLAVFCACGRGGGKSGSAGRGLFLKERIILTEIIFFF